MKSLKSKRPYKKIALALSLCALIAWALLGTGTSLAWFADTSDDVNNIFHFADFEVELSHRLTDGSWEKVGSQTKLFDEKALYEPGYVQIVYLKVENKGSRAFQFKTAVNVVGYTLGTNVYNEEFNLKDHLKFGLVTAKTEKEMKNSIPNRESAKQLAREKLKDYATDMAVLDGKDTAFIALIVRMPEQVGNVANYRGETAPEVKLGIIVTAEQMKN